MRANLHPAWSLKTAPTQEPIALDEVKRYSRIDTDDEDVELEALIAAGRQWVEQYTGRSLITQTWQLSLQHFADRVWLPMATPLQSVTAVTYYDSANALQTLSASIYAVPSWQEPPYITLVDAASWPVVARRDDAVRIEYVAGWTSPSLVPATLRQAIRLLVGHWYENRETTLVGTISKEVEFAATALCAPHRVFWREPECAA